MRNYVLSVEGESVSLEPICDAEPAAGADEGKPAKAPQHPLKFPHDSDLFERLERARRVTAVRLPRNTWILQAIAEKLERDGR